MGLPFAEFISRAPAPERIKRLDFGRDGGVDSAEWHAAAERRDTEPAPPPSSVRHVYDPYAAEARTEIPPPARPPRDWAELDPLDVDWVPEETDAQRVEREREILDAGADVFDLATGYTCAWRPNGSRNAGRRPPARARPGYR